MVSIAYDGISELTHVAKFACVCLSFASESSVKD